MSSAARPSSAPDKLRQAITAERTTLWPTAYRNSETGSYYVPHHADEERFLALDRPRYVLVRGGEGSGKSVAGIIKDLERLRRGMTGIMVSPDLEHFKKSLWKEFRRWCPWHMVVPEQRYRQSQSWEPPHQFTLVFTNGAELICGGIKESEASSWEGPNVHFFHFDEGRRHRTAVALKVLAGRIRLAGPTGEPPQGWITTTPRKHWLYEYFGQMLRASTDPFAAFKHSATDYTFRTQDNVQNLDPNYVRERRATLTEQEARVTMDAAWEDEGGAERFVPSMTLWDACYSPLPPLHPSVPLVVALDGAVGRADGVSDCFAMVAMSRHWDPSRADDLVVWEVRTWQATAGTKLDYEQIEAEIIVFLRAFNVVQIAYDSHELHYFMQRLSQYVWCEPFSQHNARLIADKAWLDRIVARGVVHGGNRTLYEHIDNSDRKVDTHDRTTLRIVKRTESLKIDANVAASMAAQRTTEVVLPLTSASAPFAGYRG